MFLDLPLENDKQTVCNNVEVKKAIIDSMNELATRNKFNGLERIK
jgi:long-chain acyl-CoA synthetase